MCSMHEKNGEQWVRPSASSMVDANDLARKDLIDLAGRVKPFGTLRNFFEFYCGGGGQTAWAGLEQFFAAEIVTLKQLNGVDHKFSRRELIPAVYNLRSVNLEWKSKNTFFENENYNLTSKMIFGYQFCREVKLIFPHNICCPLWRVKLGS